MDVAGQGVDDGIDSLTLTGSLWANMISKMESSFTRDKTPYHG
jgi:hypothetical protein